MSTNNSYKNLQMYKIIGIAACLQIPLCYGYAKGMSRYIAHNYKGDIESEKKSILKSLKNEKVELREEIKGKRLFGIIEEGCDVAHTYMKYQMVRYIPINVLMTPYPWLITYWTIIPTTAKHGIRYLSTGCIRNHKNPNNMDHVCDY